MRGLASVAALSLCACGSLPAAPPPAPPPPAATPVDAKPLSVAAPAEQPVMTAAEKEARRERVLALLAGGPSEMPVVSSYRRAWSRTLELAPMKHRSSRDRAKLRDRLNACAKEHGPGRGFVLIEAEIDAEGTIRQPRVHAPPGEHAPLVACMTTALEESELKPVGREPVSPAKLRGVLWLRDK